MSYQTSALAKLAGISNRTLYYYDEIGLLKPDHLTESGYRIYTQKQVDQLELILLYRSMDLPLKQIKTLIDQPEQKRVAVLQKQRETMLENEQRIQHLVALVDQTIQQLKGEITMTDQEKFERFKQEAIQNNTEQFGKELNAKYDDQTIKEANNKFAAMNQETYQAMQLTEGMLIDKLALYLKDDHNPKVGQEIFKLHKIWLSFTLPKYTAEIHKNLGQMYLSDPRFTEYYDQKAGVGATKALNNIIQYFAKTI